MPKLPDHLLNVKDMDGVRRALKALSDNQVTIEQQFDNMNTLGGGGVDPPIPPGRPDDPLRPNQTGFPPRRRGEGGEPH